MLAFCTHAIRLVLLASLLATPAAFADGRISVEAGGGLSRIYGTQPFFGTSEATLGYGVALGFTTAVQLTRVNSRARIFFGVSHRYDTGSDAGAQFGLQAMYPMLRLALPGLFLSAGATPFAWRKDTSAGQDGWIRTTNSIAYLGEAGIEYGLSPEASLLAVATGQAVSTSGSTSPKPCFDVTAQIRIYFLPSQNEGGASSGPSSSDFLEGWRYPFGIPKK